MPLLEVLLDAVGVVGVVDVLEVGLVEHRHDVLGDMVEVGVELGARVRRPGRVVRQADVDDLGQRGNRRQHRLEVVTPVAQRNHHRHGAELARVDHVARERRPAADHLVARLERRLAETVDEAVGAGPGNDLLETQAEPLGQRGPQPKCAAVRVAVQLGAQRSIASRASANGPNGPSFDASLTTRSSPSSR